MRYLPILLLAACATTRAPEAPSDRLIADQRSGRAVALDEMLDALAKEDVVFLGETHLDDNTHRFELEVYEGLAARRKVVLAMEMFERDVQGAIDDYLAGRIDERTFLERSRAWHNYRSGYRPLVEAAKRLKLPVVASNAPSALMRKPREQLSPEERALVAEELFDNSEAYWERVARATRGHMDMSGDRLTSAQNVWDNTMGESCAKALDAHPGALVLHVNGGFHSAYRDGAAYQLKKRKPEARVAVVDIALVNDIAGLEPFGGLDRADFIAFVLARARGPQEGFHAVTAFGELRYRFSLPKERPHGTVPLLVWLGDDGFRASDAMAPLSVELGEMVAIAVIEPPYPMLADDLSPGGRWFLGETFQEDLGVLGDGISRIVDYLKRNYPIDPARVVLAGEGTGATVVAATSLYESGLDVPAFADGPKRFRNLRMLALPGSGGAPGARRLTVKVPEEDEAWWKEEAEAWCRAGLPTKVDPYLGMHDALGIAVHRDGQEIVNLLLVHDTPRARLWGETYALRLYKPGRTLATVIGSEDEAIGEGPVEMLAFEGEPFPEGKTPIPVETLMDGRALPVAGIFGGTTILVVPPSATEEQRAAWKKLEETDAIKKKSKFARLVVLFESNGRGGAEGQTSPWVPGLAEALKAVKDAGRSVVLIVPAAFCADAGTMARIREDARPYEDILDISYLPGLGGNLLPPSPPPSK